MRIAGNRFLVLGRAGMDFYADPPGARVEDAQRFVCHLGGSAANIATQLVKLGSRAHLVTCLSEDAVGRYCLAALARYGIGSRHVRLVGGGLRSSLAVTETRNVDCQSVIYRNGAADFALTDEDIEAVDFSAHDALVVTGTALAAEPSRSATMKALDLARKAGLATILDVDYRPYSWDSAETAGRVSRAAARASDIIIGNDLEFGVLAGSDDQGLALARQLVAEGAGIAVYKMGERGAVTVSAEGEFATGIYRSQALKPTGAGDSFMGGFLSGLVRGLPLRDAVLRGSAAAAITVSRVGCAPAAPETDELDSFLAERATDAYSAI